MKRMLGLLMVTVLLLAACGEKADNTGEKMDEAYFLNGALKEINGDSVLIDEETAGLVWVTLEDGLNLEVTVNSIVRIQFNGTIAESYPGQARGHSLEVVKEFLGE